MKLTIYTTTVPVTSQEMANRLLNVCKEYGLPYFDKGFTFHGNKIDCFFRKSRNNNDFYISMMKFDLQIISESEWMELLKNTEL